MQATVRDLDGDDAGSIDLPEVFETPLRPDLIKRAVVAAQANRKQDYGADEFAGLRTPAESMGSGRGMSHDPRQDGVVKRVPHAVGGRRAHPPKPEKERGKSINRKERQLATQSAIAATADADAVADRGHAFDDIERADEGKTVRAGQGTTRGRKYQQPRSILFVTSDEPSKAARNLAGADVATAEEVNVEDLAPGTHPGRLTIFTESAIEEVADR